MNPEVCIITPVALDFDQFSVAEIGNLPNKPDQSGHFVQVGKRVGSQNSAYLTVKKCLVSSGFFTFIAADCKYGGITTKSDSRKCRNNERRRQGGRSQEPAWEQVSSLSRAFSAIALKLVEVWTADMTGWLQRLNLHGERSQFILATG